MAFKVITPDDCLNIDGQWRIFCEQYLQLKDGQDDLERDLYIMAGALGGAALVLFILVITLFVKLNNGFKALSKSGDDLKKRGFNTYTGRPLQGPANPAFTPSPPPYGGGGPPPQAIGTGGYDASSGGVGVRVLPRNPPPVHNQNHRSNANDKYY